MILVSLWFCEETQMPSTHAICSAGPDDKHLECRMETLEVTEIGFRRKDGEVHVRITA